MGGKGISAEDRLAHLSVDQNFFGSGFLFLPYRSSHVRVERGRPVLFADGSVQVSSARSTVRYELSVSKQPARGAGRSSIDPALVPPEVRDYEPPIALFGGENGLDGLRQVLDESRSKLAPGGWLVMEFGCGQDDCVVDLVTAFPELSIVKIRHDLQDIPRTAVIRRST